LSRLFKPLMVVLIVKRRRHRGMLLLSLLPLLPF
jgi:hypothetical protein